MPIKIAINGFGRIGRTTLRTILTKKLDVEIVAINDLTDASNLAHLLKYDSAYGIFPGQVEVQNDSLVVDGVKIKCLAEKDPANLPWKELNVDIVLECTGFFTDLAGAKKHLSAGAKKVIISAPGKGEGIPTYVFGGNAEQYDPEKDDVISMGSCTTNCYVPITKILHDEFKVERGYMMTVHAITNDQRILDAPHKDLRRARTALDNIIPTTSSSDKATTEVIPELKGKLHAMAMRVPVRVGSVIYAVYDLKKKTKAGEVNEVIKKAVEGDYKGIVKYETEPIVSSDIIGSSYSAIFDSLLTNDGDDLVKVVAWYDNEWGYSCRFAEFAEFVGKKL